MTPICKYVFKINLYLHCYLFYHLHMHKFVEHETKIIKLPK